jgi:hypothetical protein
VSAASGGSPGVTAAIAAHDESANIEACIASVEWIRRDLRYNANLVHEHVDVPLDAQTGDLDAALVHYTYTSLDQYFEKFDRYSGWWAEQNYAKGRRVGAGAVVFRPPARFFRMYLLKGDSRRCTRDRSRRSFRGERDGEVRAPLGVVDAGTLARRLKFVTTGGGYFIDYSAQPS